MADLDRIQKFYIAYYGRPADTIGLEYWANALDVDLGGDQTEMVKNFGSSEQPEYQNLYGTNPIADFIKLVHLEVHAHTREKLLCRSAIRAVAFAENYDIIRFNLRLGEIVLRH